MLDVVWAHPAHSAGLIDLLDDGERVRVSSLRRAGDRRRFVSAHALLRLVVAGITGTRADAVRLAATCRTCGGAHGRPHLVDFPDLQVSLSHAADRILVAVTSAGPVGVDVEAHPAAGFDGFADVALAPDERADTIKQRAIVWTRKEAILKATGHGLAVSPADLLVSRADSAPALLRWPDSPAPDVHLADVDVGTGYAACVAVIAARAAPVRLSCGDDALGARQFAAEQPLADDPARRLRRARRTPG